ncbi:MAG: hypothetical protein AAGH92_09880, partial [Planctomycetota bacterium]
MTDVSDDVSLQDVLANAWTELHHATTTAKHGFHLPTLCTTPIGFDPNRAAPEARVVVLRSADAPDADERLRGSVAAHTDTRSPKAEQLRQHPYAAWVFYDGPRRLQLRIAGPTELLTFEGADEQRSVVEERWNASTLSSRRCYLAPSAPGSEAQAASPNLPIAFRDKVPKHEAETEPGKANFAVIRTRVAALDVLHLHHAGHRRASFIFNTTGGIERQT